MAIKLTDDDDFDDNHNSRPSNNNSNTNDDNSSSSNRFNVSASDAKTAGIAALVGVIFIGLWKFPKMTIFLLLIAGGGLYYMYGDQELLGKWGIKKT
jgi:hypothetical protein